MLAMATDPGVFLDKALRESGLSHDVAWRTMRFANAGMFSKALAGTRPLCVRKIQSLPWAVKVAFVSMFMADAAVEHSEELLADRKRMAKASLSSTSDQQKAG